MKTEQIFGEIKDKLTLLCSWKHRVMFSESWVKLLMDIPITAVLTVKLFGDISRKRDGELNSNRRMLMSSLSSKRVLGTETLAMPLSGTFIVHLEPEFILRSVTSIESTCEYINNSR